MSGGGAGTPPPPCVKVRFGDLILKAAIIAGCILALGSARVYVLENVAAAPAKSTLGGGRGGTGPVSLAGDRPKHRARAPPGWAKAGAANEWTGGNETAVVIIGNYKYGLMLVQFLDDLRDKSRGNFQGPVAMVISADMTPKQRKMLETDHRVTLIEHEWGKAKKSEHMMCPR